MTSFYDHSRPVAGETEHMDPEYSDRCDGCGHVGRLKTVRSEWQSFHWQGGGWQDRVSWLLLCRSCEAGRT